MIPISERLHVAEFRDDAAKCLLIDCRSAGPPDQHTVWPIVAAIPAASLALARFVREEREYARPSSVGRQTREKLP
jgi:hypothetical protein